MITERGWQKLAAPIHPIHIGLVREFYANARVRRTGARVQVRNKMVDFSVEAIRAYYELPTIVVDEYQAMKCTDIDFPSLLQVLGAPESTWRYSTLDPSIVVNCSASRLSKFGKAWNQFICGNLMPSSNNNEIPRDRFILLYCICARHPFDAATVIHDQIIHSIFNASTHALAFGSLISGLCAVAGIPTHAGDLYVMPKQFSHSSIQRGDPWPSSTPHPDGLGFITPTTTNAPPSSMSQPYHHMPDAAGPSTQYTHVADPSLAPPESSTAGFTQDRHGTILLELQLEQRRANRRILRRLEDLQTRHVHLASYVNDYTHRIDPAQDPLAQQHPTTPVFPYYLLQPYHSPTSSDDDDPTVGDHDE